MTFTLSGPVLLLIILYFGLFKPTRLAYVLVFFAPFSSTAIINFGAVGYKSGGLGLTPAMLCIILFIASQLVFGLAFRAVRVSNGLLIQVGLVGLFAAVVIASFVSNAAYGGVTAFQMTQTVYAMIGLVVTMLLAFEFSRPGGIDSFVRTLRAAAIFVSLWGIVQFVCYSTKIPYPEFLFNNSKSDSADAFDQVSSGTIRIASVAIEPSFFASSLLHFTCFAMTILIAEPRFRTRYWIWPTVLSAMLLVLSTSSTAYFGLVVLGGLLFIRWPREALAIGAPVVVAGGAVLLLVPRAASVLASMTIDKSDTLSYIERTNGAVMALRTFVENPVLGRAWGSVQAFNAVTATLANVGLIGALVFTIAGAATLLDLQPWRIARRDDSNWKLVAYALGCQHALLVALAISISSGIHYVVADDWCFWAFAIAVSSALKLSIGAPRKALIPGRRKALVAESATAR